MEAKVVQSVRLELGLIQRLKKECGENDVSEFIREAIEEKLSRKKIADDTGMEVLKFIQKMDPEAIIRKLVDQELVSQFTYEEIKKQNEVLKLLLLRSTCAATFSYHILDEHFPGEAIKSKHQTVEKVNNELTGLGWFEKKVNL